MGTSHLQYTAQIKGSPETRCGVFSVRPEVTTETSGSISGAHSNYRATITVRSSSDETNRVKFFQAWVREIGMTMFALSQEQLFPKSTGPDLRPPNCPWRSGPPVRATRGTELISQEFL